MAIVRRRVRSRSCPPKEQLANDCVEVASVVRSERLADDFDVPDSALRDERREAVVAAGPMLPSGKVPVTSLMTLVDSVVSRTCMAGAPRIKEIARVLVHDPLMSPMFVRRGW